MKLLLKIKKENKNDFVANELKYTVAIPEYKRGEFKNEKLIINWGFHTYGVR